MTPEEFNAKFAEPVYQGWKRTVGQIALHPATAFTAFVIAAIVLLIFLR